MNASEHDDADERKRSHADQRHSDDDDERRKKLKDGPDTFGDDGNDEPT